MTPLCKLLPLMLVVAWLPAQEDRADARERTIEQRLKEESAGRGEGKEGELSDAEMRHLTPEERLARNVSRNTSGLCRFVSKVKPEKLMPGQSGMLVVTALLNGQAVIPFPAPFEMLGARQQGLVSLGELAIRPADAGTLATAYRGRPVYDNFAVLEIPVAMSPAAELGKKQQIAVDLRFDIYDGTTAQPVGRFVDHVTAEVVVGLTADPAVQGVGQRPDAAAAPVEPEPAAAPTAGAGAVDSGTPGRVIDGQEPQAADPAPVAGVPSDSGSPAHDWSEVGGEDSGVPIPVWIGGGLVLVLLVLLVARKKS